MYNKSDAVSIFFCGGIAFVSLFIWLLYAKNREKVYLFYALYLIFILIYGFIHIESGSWVRKLLAPLFDDTKRLVEPVTILSFSFYIYFAAELVEIKRQNKKLYQILNVFGTTLLIYATAYLLLYPFFISFEHKVFLTARIFLFPISAVCLVWVYISIKSPLKIYLLTGSAFYFIGAMVATIRYSVKNLPIEGFYELTAPVYFESGIMIEVLCFALALSHRIFYLHQQKEQASKNLIQQLIKNEQLSKNMNERLEIEVQQRTREIIITQEKLAEQEKKHLEAVFEKELAEAEILTRSLQINPHFLFNCLNAIKYLIQSHQNQKASKYLVIFSRFIRQILETSQQKLVTLKEELEITERYLTLEAIRFDHHFNFKIVGKEEVQLENIKIPPLLLQPFVENAVWHGLLPSNREKKNIDINLFQRDKKLVIRIEDNGVGRQHTPANSQKDISKSIGIHLTKERIRLYNQVYQNALNCEIIDKVDDDGTPLGTVVEVTLQNLPKND